MKVLQVKIMNFRKDNFVKVGKQQKMFVIDLSKKKPENGDFYG